MGRRASSSAGRGWIKVNKSKRRHALCSCSAHSDLRSGYSEIYAAHMAAPGSVGREDLDRALAYFIANPGNKENLAKALLLRRELEGDPRARP